MKRADIKIGETYSRRSGRSSYDTGKPVKVLRIGRYARFDDETEYSYHPVRVVVEETRPTGESWTYMVPLSQIEGLWSELGPKYEEEKRQREAAAAKRRAEDEDRKVRWAHVSERLQALGIEQKIDPWNMKQPSIHINLETMERLLNMSEGI